MRSAVESGIKDPPAGGKRRVEVHSSVCRSDEKNDAENAGDHAGDMQGVLGRL